MARRSFTANEVCNILAQDVDRDEDVSAEDTIDESSEEDNEPTPVTSDESNDNSNQSSSKGSEHSESEADESFVHSITRGRGRVRGNIVSMPDATSACAAPSNDVSVPGTSSSQTTGRSRTRPAVNISRNVTKADETVQTWQSKHGTVWYKQPVKQPSGRLTAANVMHGTPGPTRFAVRNVDSPVAAFQLFMRNPLLKEILKWTNIEGSRVYSAAFKEITYEELSCFLGLSIL